MELGLFMMPMHPRKKIGFGTLLMIAHDWDDKARWLRSMELLKHEVIPALPTV